MENPYVDLNKHKELLAARRAIQMQSAEEMAKAQAQALPPMPERRLRKKFPKELIIANATPRPEPSHFEIVHTSRYPKILGLLFAEEDLAPIRKRIADSEVGGKHMMGWYEGIISRAKEVVVKKGYSYRAYQETVDVEPVVRQVPRVLGYLMNDNSHFAVPEPNSIYVPARGCTVLLNPEKVRRTTYEDPVYSFNTDLLYEDWTPEEQAIVDMHRAANDPYRNRNPDPFSNMKNRPKM